MKKYLFIVMVLLLTSGCVSINDASIDTLASETLNSKYRLYNHINSGYKYYLPRTLNSTVTDEYNEIIKSKYYDYYLYVDLVAYHNKKMSFYIENEDIFYSKRIENGDKSGIIDIKSIDSDYLVRIIYNYAKIEVKCSSKDLNEVVTNSLVILSSITYIDDAIASNLNKNEFASAEEQVNIFDNTTVDTNYLDEVDDTYTGNEDDYDPDVIKERG
ncbi:MAG: hypothetical protein OSJ65_06660 [Bacilli bacterium]|nr:hypothetical protein [Bacilli bacterium]